MKTNQIKFMWNGIKVDGKLYGANYSGGALINYPDGSITIYGTHYRDLPQIVGLNVQNGSDYQTDYHEQDRIRVEPSNPWYSQVKAALDAQEIHRAKVSEKRAAKYAARAA